MGQAGDRQQGATDLALPADAVIDTTPRGAGQALTLDDLAIPD